MPIAIVGIACRFPGANGPDELWELLREGRDAVTTIPADRFDAPAYHATARDDGTALISALDGGFLERIDGFDAEFFGISPYEAARMDVQQGLFLETAWEAIEDAGLVPERLAGSRTGVYSAQLTMHYWDELHRTGVWDLHAMTGAEGRGNLPARLAYVLDLRGPAVSVDAACSSALLAVHMACQALRLGEIDAAIVGGTNVITAPADSVALSQGGLLSPTGRCRFGDASADGFVRSEGIAVVVLKPLSRALADRDRIYSVVLGGAATNDGASNGHFLTPSLEGQRETLRAACASAGVSPRDIDYVEANGAGTQTGDAVELGALGSVLGAGRGPRERLLVGSVKSNLGHTESAAGLAGLIKVALSLRHGEIPPTLHVRRPNPEVDWDGAGIRLARRRVRWPRSGHPPLAGVSSFGISGSNVHVVVSGPPQPEPGPAGAAGAGSPAPRREPAAGDAKEGPYILPVSARSAAALDQLTNSYAGLLLQPGAEQRLRDLCYSAGARRAHHRHRRAVVGDDAAQLAAALRAEAGRPGPLPAAQDERPAVVFVFPGLGAQWTGMARDLLAQCPPFARAMAQCDAAVRAEAGWSVLDLLASDDPLTDVGLAQPAVWAVEYALAAVWREWGVEPSLAIGHSMGEVAAAAVSGALSLADAAAVICRRSALMRRASDDGAMTSVQLPADEARELAGRRGGRAVVAVHNSPNSTVLAGDAGVLTEIERELSARGVFWRRVNARVAAHGPAMDPLLDELVGLLGGVRPRAGAFPIQSTVHRRATLGAEFDAGYWARNLREPVRFCEAVQNVLADRGPVLFLEMSPHPLLAHSLQECAEVAEGHAAVVSSLHRDDAGLGGLLRALTQVYEHGCELDWEAIAGGGRFVAPPRYPWQHKRFRAADAVPTVPARLLAGARRDGAHGRGGSPQHPDVPGALPVMPHARLGRRGTRHVPPAVSAASVSAGSVSAASVSAGSLPGPAAHETAAGAQVAADAKQPAGAADHLRGALREEAAIVLGMSPDLIDPGLPLTLLGLDSVMAGVLSRRIGRRLGLSVRVADLLGGGTLETLAGPPNEPALVSEP